MQYQVQKMELEILKCRSMTIVEIKVGLKDLGNGIDIHSKNQ